MPKEVENIIIEVSPKQPLPPPSGKATEIECVLKPLGNATHGRLKPDGKIQLDSGFGPFCIQFTANGLDWADSEPFWIRQDQCPKNAHVAAPIWIEEKANGKTITLLNMNVGDACELHYRMNFKGDFYCDPVMENGGGNIFSTTR
jgi:hypothetical protein